MALTGQSARSFISLKIDSRHLRDRPRKVLQVHKDIRVNPAHKVLRVRKAIRGSYGIVHAKFYESVKPFATLTGLCAQRFASP